MIVKKRLNNNVIYASNGKQRLILIGKGLGFQVNPGDVVDDKKVEKTFVPTDGMNLSQMAVILNDISIEDIRLGEEIIGLAELELGKKLNPNLLFPLLDHIRFAIKRHEDNLNLQSPIHWEVKNFYRKETYIGFKALEIIKKYTGVDLPQTEATFLALHFVNAQFDEESIQSTIEYTEMMNKILQIVRYHFQIDINQESFMYNRFITHLRYLSHAKKKQ